MASGEHLKLRVGVDQTSVKTSANSLKTAFSGLGKTIAAAFAVKSLANFAKQSVSLASDVEEVQNVVDVAFGSMTDKMEAFADTAIETYGISKLTAKKTGSTYMSMAKGMGLADETAADMALSLTGLSADMASFYNVSQEYADIALKSVFTGETETLKQYGIVMTQTNLQEFARQKGITKSISAMNQQEQVMLRYQYVMQQTNLAQGDFVRTQDSWANQTRILAERWKEVQIAFGETFKEIATSVLPTINAMLQGLTQVAAVLSAGLANIGLISKKQEDTTEKTAKNISNAASAQDDLAKATKKANKEAKGQVAAFDEVNQISKDTAEETDTTGGTSGGLAGLGIEPFETGTSTDYVAEVSAMTAAIMEIIGGALIAIGVILLVFGNIPLGIGFIIAGATIFAVAAFSGTPGNISEQAATLLTTIMGFVAGALVAIGIVLIMLGSMALGIGFIIAGAVALAVTVVAITQFSPDKIKSTLTTIVGIVSGALLALGIMLTIFAGPTPLNIGLIVAGAVGLVSLVAMNIGEISEETKKTITTIMAIAGSALLVLGIILVCCGVIPMGISLIAAGAISLISVIAMNKNAIVDWIKGVWNSIKSFWNKYIAVVFTKQFWQKIFGVIKDAFKWVLNALIGFINLWIKGLNILLAPLRGIIYGVAKAFGKNVKFSEIAIPTIPKLAKGAVLPANKPFLAQLGDQKNGRNLEAPESLLRDIYSEQNEPIVNLLSQMLSELKKGHIIKANNREIARSVREGEASMGTNITTGSFANAY